MANNIIKIIDGGLSVDDRGVLRYVNEFNISKAKRFYQVENFSKNYIRAFHGHKHEAKYVYVIKGTILLCLVKLFKNVSSLKNSKVQRYILSSNKPQILYIPPNYANGFKALEKNTITMFFSTKTLNDSLSDDIRYPYDYWGKNIWKTLNR